MIDLTQFTDEQLAEHHVISGAEIMLRHAFDKNGKISLKTRDLMLAHFSKLDDELLKVVLQYSLSRFEEDDENFIQRFIELNPKHEDIGMTIAERLEQKGMQKGMQEASCVIAQNMLKEGDSVDKVARITGLSSEMIVRFKEETH